MIKVFFNIFFSCLTGYLKYIFVPTSTYQLRMGPENLKFYEGKLEIDIR
jgi:hypothetical protein